MMRLIGFIFIIFCFNAFAVEDITVLSLSNGNCFLENKEFIKIASFSDNQSFNSTKAKLESDLLSIVESEFHESKSKYHELDMSIHCGAYGASIVSKIEVDGRGYCLWAKFNNNKLEVRSLGGHIEKVNSIGGNSCDGYKFGELIVGIKNNEVIEQLRAQSFSSIIKEVSIVSNGVLKIVLTSEFEKKENEAIALINNSFGDKNIKYIELNYYRHPVGEFFRL